MRAPRRALGEVPTPVSNVWTPANSLGPGPSHLWIDITTQYRTGSSETNRDRRGERGKAKGNAAQEQIAVRAQPPSLNERTGRATPTTFEPPTRQQRQLSAGHQKSAPTHRRFNGPKGPAKRRETIQESVGSPPAPEGRVRGGRTQKGPRASAKRGPECETHGRTSPEAQRTALMRRGKGELREAHQLGRSAGCSPPRSQRNASAAEA